MAQFRPGPSKRRSCFQLLSMTAVLAAVSSKPDSKSKPVRRPPATDVGMIGISATSTACKRMNMKPTTDTLRISNVASATCLEAAVAKWARPTETRWTEMSS